MKGFITFNTEGIKLTSFAFSVYLKNTIDNITIPKVYRLFLK